MCKVAAFFLLLVATAEHFEPAEASDSSLFRNNLFNKINNEIQIITNKIFTCLRVDNNFVMNRNVGLLLTMFRDFENIAESNYQIYIQIYNASKVDRFDNVTIKALFNLTEIIDTLIAKEYRFYNTVIKTNNFTSIENIRDKFNKFGLDNAYVTAKQRFTSVNVTQIDSNKTAHLQSWVAQKSAEHISNRRIYKGNIVKIKKFPFMASILVEKKFACAGSIISARHIITAASAIQVPFFKAHNDPQTVTVRVSSRFPTRSGFVFPVDEVIVHPKYDPAHLSNNLAIVQLQEPLNLGVQFGSIKKIDLARDEEASYEGGGITVLGWGNKDKESSYHGPLTSDHLQFFGLDSCKDVYTERYVNDNNFCAGFVDVGSGACSGDIGGPGLMGSNLIGVISFGPPVCGATGVPTVFTKVNKNIGWIDSIITQEEINLRTRTTRHYRSELQTVTEKMFKFLPKWLGVYKTVSARKQQVDKNDGDMATLKKLFKKYIVSGNAEIEDILSSEDQSKDGNEYDRAGPTDVFNIMTVMQRAPGVTKAQPKRKLELKKYLSNTNFMKEIGKKFETMMNSKNDGFSKLRHQFDSIQSVPTIRLDTAVEPNRLDGRAADLTHFNINDDDYDSKVEALFRAKSPNPHKGPYEVEYVSKENEGPVMKSELSAKAANISSDVDNSYDYLDNYDSVEHDIDYQPPTKGTTSTITTRRLPPKMNIPLQMRHRYTSPPTPLPPMHRMRDAMGNRLQ